MAPDNRLDDLTAREREVLDLVRLGLTNEEIAGRLGITEAGAKYHVSQILSRLGVATREEAAAVTLAPRGRWWPVFWPGLPIMLIGAAMIAPALLGAAALISDRSHIRLCAADDLTAAYANENGETGGTFVSGYGLGNRADAPCRLEGPPDIRLVGPGKDELPTSASYSPFCPPEYLESCIESRPVIIPGNTGEVEFRALKPGQVLMTLVWRVSDGVFSCGSPRAFAVRFLLQSGDAVDASVPEPIRMAPCDGRVLVSDFRQIGTPRILP